VVAWMGNCTEDTRLGEGVPVHAMLQCSDTCILAMPHQRCYLVDALAS
jgi:hypothetical protein